MPNTTVSQAQTNLAYEFAVRGGILPSLEEFTPYAITVDRYATTLNYTALKNMGVTAAVFEAGYLYDSIHIRQSRYKNPQLDSQIQRAIDNNVAYGLYADVRAKNVDEAKEELRELALVVRRYSPQIGLWLRLLFNNPVATNNKILDKYYDTLLNMGFKDQLGLYVTRSQLDKITWDDYYEDWYLWLIDPISNLSAMDELLTPAFFMLGE